MACLFYFAIIALQLTNSLACGPEFMPLKCFFTRNNILIDDNMKHNSSLKNWPGINTFDVLKFENHIVNKDGWTLETDNAEIVGLGNAVIDDYSINFKTSIFQITFSSDYIVKYDYRTSGYLFTIPIQGEGVLDVILEKAQVGMTIPFVYEKIDGQDHVLLKGFNMWYIIGHAKYNFSNLYNGDKTASDLMHDHINKNWKYVSANFGSYYYNIIGEEMFKVFRNYLFKYALKDLSNC